jgi:hypothetical protein
MATPTITAAQGGDEPHRQPPTSGLTATAAHYERWGWLVLQADDRLLLTSRFASVVTFACALSRPLKQAREGIDAAPGSHGRRYEQPSTWRCGCLPGLPRRWLLLTESADDASPVNLVRLRARNGLTHRCDTVVPLPPSRMESGVVSWQVPPSLDSPAGEHKGSLGVFALGHADSAQNFFGQLLEVSVGIPGCLEVAAKGSIGRSEGEDRFPSLLGQRH